MENTINPNVNNNGNGASSGGGGGGGGRRVYQLADLINTGMRRGRFESVIIVSDTVVDATRWNHQSKYRVSIHGDRNVVMGANIDANTAFEAMAVKGDNNVVVDSRDVSVYGDYNLVDSGKRVFVKGNNNIVNNCCSRTYVSGDGNKVSGIGVRLNGAPTKNPGERYDLNTRLQKEQYLRRLSVRHQRERRELLQQELELLQPPYIKLTLRGHDEPFVGGYGGEAADGNNEGSGSISYGCCVICFSNKAVAMSTCCFKVNKCIACTNLLFKNERVGDVTCEHCRGIVEHAGTPLH